jgi:DNA-binding response OmpR family regulator
MRVAAPTILIVDDNQATCELLEDLLTEEGYRVEILAQGRAAITRAATGGVDLMLLDWRLPDLTGAAVLEALGAGGQTLPVVILSAGQQGESGPPPAGAVAAIPKPFEIDELLGVLSRYCPLPP